MRRHQTWQLCMCVLEMPPYCGARLLCGSCYGCALQQKRKDEKRQQGRCQQGEDGGSQPVPKGGPAAASRQPANQAAGAHAKAPEPSMPAAAAQPAHRQHPPKGGGQQQRRSQLGVAWKRREGPQPAEQPSKPGKRQRQRKQHDEQAACAPQPLAAAAIAPAAAFSPASQPGQQHGLQVQTQRERHLEGRRLSARSCCQRCTGHQQSAQADATSIANAMTSRL